MRRPVLTQSVVALAAAALLSACASETKPPSASVASTGRQCFFANQVNSFQPVDEEHVNVRVGVDDIYQLTTFGICNDLDWTNAIALVTRGGSSVCTGRDDSEIINRTPTGTHRCQVKSVRKLTVAEATALPKGQKP